jgi:hypothetical protein
MDNSQPAKYDYKYLQTIIRKNDYNKLTLLLNELAIVDDTPIDYVGLLRTAMYAEAVECMDILLKVPNINVNFTNSDYRLPILWLASSLGKVNAVKKLLESTTIDIHKGPPLRTLMEVDNRDVVVDVGGLSPLDVATIELNTLRNKPDSMFQSESITKNKKEKIKNYLTIIALLTTAGAVYKSTDPPTEMKRKVVPRGGKSKRRRKKRQSKKTRKGRSRKYKK